MRFLVPLNSLLVALIFVGCSLRFGMVDCWNPAALSQRKYFTPRSSQQSQRSNALVLFNTGGWGIGPQRELTPEEFATGGAQNKKYFEGYQIRNRGEFMRQVASDKDQMKRGEIDELLGVAAAAGIKIKDPKERLNKFDPSIIEDDEEDLDLSVQWDEEEPTRRQRKVRRSTSSAPNDGDSITRLDEDTGALGVW